MKTMDVRGHRFYCEFGFDSDERIGLCFDYNFLYSDNTFEICYYDIRDGWIQIRTII